MRSRLTRYRTILDQSSHYPYTKQLLDGYSRIETTKITLGMELLLGGTPVQSRGLTLTLHHDIGGSGREKLGLNHPLLD